MQDFGDFRVAQAFVFAQDNHLAVFHRQHRHGVGNYFPPVLANVRCRFRRKDEALEVILWFSIAYFIQAKIVRNRKNPAAQAFLFRETLGSRIDPVKDFLE